MHTYIRTYVGVSVMEIQFTYQVCKVGFDAKSHHKPWLQPIRLLDVCVHNFYLILSLIEFSWTVKSTKIGSHEIRKLVGKLFTSRFPNLLYVVTYVYLMCVCTYVFYNQYFFTSCCCGLMF